MLAGRLASVRSALDLDTGGGEVLSEAGKFPERMVATEGWPPNARRAAERLGPRGVEVVEATTDAPLPFPDHSFELVTARHPPVRPDWNEIHRVLAPPVATISPNMLARRRRLNSLSTSSVRCRYSGRAATRRPSQPLRKLPG